MACVVFWYACNIVGLAVEKLKAPVDEAQSMRLSSLRIPARPMVRPVLLTVLFGLSLTAVLWADEPPRPPTGEVRLGSGRVVDYTIHFDRNSLRDSLRLGNGLIALTSSGTLLRFELPEVRLVRERIDTEKVTCLGRGEGGAILAGLSDGRVCRVDPATLEFNDVTKLPAPPQWIGWGQAQGNRPAGLVVVTRPTKPANYNGRHYDLPYLVIHDLATGKTFEPGELATSFLLDGAGRLWLGVDKGEWGGRIIRVDLAKGIIATIKPPPSREPDRQAFWEGIYGFIELRDGQVWAFGGTSHMGVNHGYVTRIDGAEPRPLVTFEPPRDAEKKPNPEQPSLPITHIVEEKDALLVFSYSDVFRVDKSLKTWKKVATLEIQYRWGRPDAMGAYPSVRAVHPPSRDGEPYVLATVGDGYVLLEGAKATSHSLPGQLGASSVDGIENSSEGLLCFQRDDRLPLWTLRAKGWEIASLAPPFEVDPASDLAEFEAKQGAWYETRVLVGPGGTIYTVSGTSLSTATRTTARRVDGKSLRLGRETTTLYPSSSFITADGTLWYAFYGGLKRFEKGRWETVALLPVEGTPSRATPLNTDGPPWLLLDRSSDRLWQLKHGAQGDNPQLTEVEIREGEKPLRISGAIPWPGRTLLLATDAGLRAYDPAAQKLSKVDLEEPPQPVTSLVRDGLGRLWLGGKSGLWMVEAGGKTLESFDRVPWIQRNKVDALAPDPHHEDGVIVALGSQGVMFVRAMRKP
jgi:hypothetical protein